MCLLSAVNGANEIGVTKICHTIIMLLYDSHILLMVYIYI